MLLPGRDLGSWTRHTTPALMKVLSRAHQTHLRDEHDGDAESDTTIRKHCEQIKTRIGTRVHRERSNKGNPTSLNVHDLEVATETKHSTGKTGQGLALEPESVVSTRQKDDSLSLFGHCSNLVNTTVSWQGAVSSMWGQFSRDVPARLPTTWWSLARRSTEQFKDEIVLDIWNLRNPQQRPNPVVRIHLNLSQQQPVFSEFLFSIYVTAHVVNSVPVTHLAKSARHRSLKRFFFAGL